MKKKGFVSTSLVPFYRLRRPLLVAITILSTMLLITQNASALSFIFSGSVTSVEDEAGLLDGSITASSIFGGSYEFDPATPPTFAAPPFDTSFARYNNTGGLAATIGNYSLTGAIEIIIENDFGSLFLDGYSPRSASPALFTNGVDSFDNTGWVWTLEDWSGSAFTSLDLPSSPPDLNEFGTNQFLIRFEGSGTGEVVRIWGSMDTLTLDPIPDPVPEPTTMLLFGTGIASLAVTRLRRKKK